MHDSLVGRKKFSALLLWEFFVIFVFPSTDKTIIEINTSLPKGEDICTLKPLKTVIELHFDTARK